jgi:hypothetical protein
LDRLEQVLNDTRDRLGHTDGQVATLVGQVTGQRLVWSTIEPRGGETVVLHEVVEESLAWPSAMWTTKCGWRFGEGRFRFGRRAPGVVLAGRECHRCGRPG